MNQEPSENSVSMAACAECGRTHENMAARFRCSGCGLLFCQEFAFSGKQWNRPGRVHLVRLRKTADSPPFTRLCGTLTRVEDATLGGVPIEGSAT